ncbi:hypothetical protein ACQUJT_12455 [Ralstonia pseudosolanacearum]|uniref:Transmembrane protein n=1 Tax=Ralstonia solanacearum TaxID=305 RepID=A0AA92K5T6_RALSL|nr:hypothetical protein [Ralstonia pseudosolanacearum]QOK94248.1 hypothetical protein HF908_22835 [Ralstonia pseudosolanacearum]QOK99051.1 hypothetical protein HF909_22020 [Ralstonia pseudosolanacearum]UWD87920.1 hypothetical protein NY025_04010 [Ralstonia pseudosolanacearum]CAH0444601.1 hypothetical protein LMG9673_04419 [Ralstonia pseudosolanacearum]
MGTLIDWQIKAWESGNVATLAFAALLLGGFKLNSILSLAQRISGRRRRFLVDALKQDGLDATTRTFLLEELNALLVQRATGIVGNQIYRATVLALIARSNGELRAGQFARAGRFLQLQDGSRIDVVIRRSDMFEYWATILYGLFLLVLALGLFSLPKLAPIDDPIAIVGLIALGVATLAFGGFMFAQTLPYTVAKRIAPVLQRLQSPARQEIAVESGESRPPGEAGLPCLASARASLAARSMA